MVSVPSEPQKSPKTPPPSVPIPSLKKAIAFVNAQESLSTEMLFKTLLVYYKPNQGRFATPRDPQFLAEAIKKGASSQVPVSAETQLNISSAIMISQFGTRIPPEVALAIAAKIDTFTDTDAQRNISAAILGGKFGNPIPQDVALALAAKLGTFTDPEAQLNIYRAIRSGRFGDPMPKDVALAIAAKLGTFTDPKARRNIAWAICYGKFGNPIRDDVALAIA